jgi:peptide deformylase
MEDEEGCLSLPNLFGQVRRAEKIVVDAFDLKGRVFEFTLTDLAGRVVQHETDHLDGVLFVDRMTDGNRRELEPQLAEFDAYFRRLQQSGKYPSDEELQQQLRDLEPS